MSTARFSSPPEKQRASGNAADQVHVDVFGGGIKHNK
jgi:hypothetical protein